MFWLEIITLAKLIIILTLKVLATPNPVRLDIKVLKKMEIHQKLKFWFQLEGRDLPWRHTKDPYLIWLSEVILQQTRVEQGLPYYWKFSERFPTVQDLAKANDDEVFKLWQGLGYYSRARSLLKTAREIERSHQGIFPANYDALISLPGIGPYTAAAVASFAFNKAHPVLDGNVKRVVSRCIKLAEGIESKKANSVMHEWLNQNMDHNNPADFNQSIMELGALICTPRKPMCMRCPIQVHCLANQEGEEEKYPIKKAKTSKQVLHLAFAFAQNENQLLIQKRKPHGIWANLWELPSRITQEFPVISDLEMDFPGVSNRDYTAVKLPSHLLSHREIRAQVFVFHYSGPASEGQKWIAKSEIENHGFPRILTRYFETGLP